MFYEENVGVSPWGRSWRRTMFCAGETVRHQGEIAMVLRPNTRRGVLLRGVEGKRWHAIAEECEPLF